MEEADARILTDEEIAQGWHADISKYSSRLQDQSLGKCISLTAVYQGMPAGYVSIYITGLSGAFSGKGFRRSLISPYWKNTGGRVSAGN